MIHKIMRLGPHYYVIRPYPASHNKCKHITFEPYAYIHEGPFCSKKQCKKGLCQPCVLPLFQIYLCPLPIRPVMSWDATCKDTCNGAVSQKHLSHPMQIGESKGAQKQGGLAEADGIF